MKKELNIQSFCKKGMSSMILTKISKNNSLNSYAYTVKINKIRAKRILRNVIYAIAISQAKIIQGLNQVVHGDLEQKFFSGVEKE